jgi:hypothetical protein
MNKGPVQLVTREVQSQAKNGKFTRRLGVHFFSYL